MENWTPADQRPITDEEISEATGLQLRDMTIVGAARVRHYGLPGRIASVYEGREDELFSKLKDDAAMLAAVGPRIEDEEKAGRFRERLAELDRSLAGRWPAAPWRGLEDHR